jgi:hypothetical protein
VQLRVALCVPAAQHSRKTSSPHSQPFNQHTDSADTHRDPRRRIMAARRRIVPNARSFRRSGMHLGLHRFHVAHPKSNSTECLHCHPMSLHYRQVHFSLLFVQFLTLHQLHTSSIDLVVTRDEFSTHLFRFRLDFDNSPPMDKRSLEERSRLNK